MFLSRNMIVHMVVQCLFLFFVQLRPADFKSTAVAELIAFRNCIKISAYFQIVCPTAPHREKSGGY